jgi:hypothetical protein
MTTATEADTDVLQALDWEPCCEARTLYVAAPGMVEERPDTCPNRADVLVTIHDWVKHEYRQKYMCFGCLCDVDRVCYGGCGAPNITQITSLRKAT